MASNPRYSLRAFARDIGISPSRLSAILKGRQGLSESSASRIAAKLGWEGEAAERFVLMVLAADSRSKGRRTEALNRLNHDSSPERAQDILQLPLYLDPERGSFLEAALEDLKKSLHSQGLASPGDQAETHVLRVTLLEK